MIKGNEIYFKLARSNQFKLSEFKLCKQKWQKSKFNSKVNGTYLELAGSSSYPTWSYQGSTVFDIQKPIFIHATLINLNYVGPCSVSKFSYYFYCVFCRSINARNKEVLGLKKRRKKSPYTGLPSEAPQSSKPYL